jgi:hypothetical protein
MGLLIGYETLRATTNALQQRQGAKAQRRQEIATRWEAIE